MSTASFVPETAALRGGAGPLRTVRATGTWSLLTGAALRLRRSDGFSHARSLAFVTMLLSLQGMIALVALFSVFGTSRIGSAVNDVAQAAAPGPVGRAFERAVRQAEEAATAGIAPLVLGVAGAVVLGSTAVGQLQRALNRLYGIERDRPTVKKYLRAALLAITAGSVITLAFLTVAFGRSLSDNLLTPLWGAARLPVTLVLLAGAVTLLFRWCPHRRPPPWRWLLGGAVVAVSLWLAATAALAAFFNRAEAFGAAYGPLAGLLGLGIWSLLASISLLYGAAVNAELEAERANGSARYGGVDRRREPVRPQAATMISGPGR